jgi:hypothetical protein
MEDIRADELSPDSGSNDRRDNAGGSMFLAAYVDKCVDKKETK